MMRRIALFAILGTLAAVRVGPARGDMLIFSDTIALSTTNWSDSVSIPQFDPALGTLDSIEFELGGHVEGDAAFESLDAAPAAVTMQLAAQITLLRPNNSPLVTTLPLVNTFDNVTAFDGVIDFGGTSGRTYDSLAGDDMDTATLMAPFSPDDATTFIGLGSVTLPCNALGVSSGSGAGNLILQFHTSASAEVRVIYTYTPIPEPAAVTLLGIGGLVCLRRRR